VTEALIGNYPKYACTGGYTVNYRLREESAQAFFIKGGERMRRNYPGAFPWTATP
jgi:hypothetical protein